MIGSRLIASVVLLSLKAAEMKQLEALEPLDQVNGDGPSLQPEPSYSNGQLRGDGGLENVVAQFPEQALRQTNIKGQMGQKGVKGDKGVLGNAGQTGSIGPVGPPGNVGPVGPKGAPGDIGPVGPAGQTGPVGPTGPSGAPGFGFGPVECPESSSDFLCFTAATLTGYRCYCASRNDTESVEEAEAWCQNKAVGSRSMTLASFQSQSDLVTMSTALGTQHKHNNRFFWTSGKVDAETKIGYWADGTAIDPLMYCQWRPIGNVDIVLYISSYYSCIQDYTYSVWANPSLCML